MPLLGVLGSLRTQQQPVTGLEWASAALPTRVYLLASVDIISHLELGVRHAVRFLLPPALGAPGVAISLTLHRHLWQSA
jgi:hypothetical protein